MLGTSLPSIATPVATLVDGVVVRRVGLFHEERMPLCDVERIVAINRDALTHDETLVGFVDGAGKALWLSEFDRHFHVAIGGLAQLLPGFRSLEGFGPTQPFERIESVLWRRP